MHAFIRLNEPAEAFDAGDVPEAAAAVDTNTSDADDAALKSVYDRFLAVPSEGQGGVPRERVGLAG